MAAGAAIADIRANIVYTRVTAAIEVRFFAIL